MIDGAGHIGQQIRVAITDAGDQQPDLGAVCDLGPRRERRPALEVVDVGLFWQQLRQAVFGRHGERLVEVVVAKDCVGAQLFGLDHRFSPCSVVGSATRPELNTNPNGIGATKAGIELLTRVWADEFGRSGVRVNAVQAGPTDTPGTAATPGVTDGLAQLTTLGRVAAADEIANAVTFLAAPSASYVNGAILQATGGQLAIAP